MSFLKIEGRGTLVGGGIVKKEGQSVELVGDQNPGPEAPPKSKRGQERGSKEDIRGVATAREATRKSRYVRVIARKAVRRDDPIEYFLPTGVGTTF